MQQNQQKEDLCLFSLHSPTIHLTNSGAGKALEIRSKFLSIAGDDLLLEIFLRLPLGRDLIRCSAVSKHWLSLISLSDNPKFISKFNDHHRNQSSEYSSILFRYSPKPSLSHRFHQLRPDNLSTPIVPNRRDYLTFLPEPLEDLTLRASCDDLLLVSATRRRVPMAKELQLYVCNPITRSWFRVPKMDILGFGVVNVYGLVRNRANLKIFVIYASDDAFISSIFCSENGMWTRPELRLFIGRRLNPEASMPNVVSSEGAIYWLEIGENDEFKGVASLGSGFDDTERVRWNLPNGFYGGISCARSKGRVCFGLVRGRVCLAQLIRCNLASFVLKVWELVTESSWVLVHRKIVMKRECRLASLLAFHPNDSNVIFIVRNCEVCEFRIEEGEYQTVCRLPENESALVMKDWVMNHLKVFTLLNPLWPTLIPQSF